MPIMPLLNGASDNLDVTNYKDFAPTALAEICCNRFCHLASSSTSDLRRATKGSKGEMGENASSRTPPSQR